jgi:hypothetical protein
MPGGYGVSDRRHRSEPRSRGRGESRRSILERIEDKLARLLGDDDDPDARSAMSAPPATTSDEGDDEPRILGGPRASAPGWDPSLAGPRFDRVDVAGVGTHAAHPVSSVDGASGTGPGGYRSTAREHYLVERASRHGPGGGGGELHRDYANWRNQQIEALDRAYEEYCRERNESFANEFGEWRTRRQDQRDALARVAGDMAVIGSDGDSLGRVEAVASGAITVAWEDSDGRKSAALLPYSWIQSVGAEVVIDRPAAAAQAKMKPTEAASRPHPAPTG